jgi:hypothetical protein
MGGDLGWLEGYESDGDGDGRALGCRGSRVTDADWPGLRMSPGEDDDLGARQ